MKKQFALLFLFLFQCALNHAQTWIKTSGPCKTENLKTIPGEWIHRGDPWYAKVPKQQEQEIRNRVATIHQFIYTLLPSSLPGMDAAWGIHSTDDYFARQSTIEHLPDDQKREKFFNGIPLVQYIYSIGFYEYSCGKYGDPNFIRKGYPREDGARVDISVNTLNQFLRRDYGGQEGMQIDGRNIRMMPPVKGNWKGNTLYGRGGSGENLVLIHRDGILPYTAVTRKQYLELCIRYFTKFFDNEMAEYAKLTSKMGVKPDPSYREASDKQKKNVLKYYQDEWKATTTAGLLDTPAIVLIYLNPDPNYPVFASEAEGGTLLVTENPNYFRKDLPKYIPQLFFLSLSPVNWPFIPKTDPMKVITEKFPIEKLQAMIDK